MLSSLGLKAPTATKTGTTIAGIVFKARQFCGRSAASLLMGSRQDGVVLGADTRSTNGDTVADKNCEKIHYIAPNIYCCGAGTAADTEAVTGAPPSTVGLTPPAGANLVRRSP
jgi:20S proteasome subunit beta 2